MEDFSLESFAAAGANVASILPPTPIVHSSWLSHELDAEVYLKLESLQESRAFKLRGAVNFLKSHAALHGALPRVVLTASGGSHGISVALAAQKLGVEQYIVYIPTNSITPEKNSRLHSLGAEVAVEGSCWVEAHRAALARVEQLNATNPNSAVYIHAFDHPWIIQGQGTVMLEALKQMDGQGGRPAAPEVVVASIGGGGLLTGIIRAFAAQPEPKPGIEFVAVETVGADWLALSLERGKRVALDKITSIATSLGADSGSDDILHTLKTCIVRNHVVTDKATVQAMWQYLEHEKALIEPAASCTVAALLEHRELYCGKRILIVICGANVSLEQAEQWRHKYLEQ